MVRRETVIYSTVRPYLLNVAIIDRDLEPEPIASTAFSVLHPLSGLSPRFLHYYLRSRIFTKFVEGQMVGMAYPAIRDERLLQGPLPIPPLSEQESIVAKVDELMALCDELEKTQEHRRSVRKAVQVSALDALTSAETPEELERAWERARRNWFAIVGSADSVPPLRDAILQLAAAGNLMPRDPRDPWTVTTLGALGEFRGGGTLGEHLKTGHTSTSENRP
jgi:type I restriction enzyme S subunit